jgi:TolB-like protein/Flp pilus assembly protein TadD
MVAAGWLLLRPATGDSGPAATASVSGVGRTSADVDESRQSIAVLPFTNRSAGTEEDAGFFASGIHDDILTQLSKIDALKVISRTSVMQYEDTQKTIGQIGHELGVATVLEGSVQRAGDRVRVNVQLIDSGTDEHLWAETYDQELTAANVFAIQSDVARKIADALETTLAPEVEERIEQRPTESLEAYELYLQGRYVMDRGTRQDREDAVQLFRRAIEADPDFALAHSWLATSYTSLLGSAYLEPSEALPPARAAAERALEIDPDLPEAHTALAEVLVSEGRWDEAEREFVRAIELNPGNARAHERYGLLIVDRGRFEAARSELEVAAELDPTSRVIRANLAFVRFLLRDFEGTENEALRMIELEPDFDYGYYILAAAQSFQGRHEEAISTATRSVELAPDDLYNLAALALVNARAQNRDRALEIADQVEQGGGSLKEIALIYGQLGEVDRAFEYLERTYQTDPGDLLFLMSDPSADPLRDDPRFDELAERAGLK